MLYLYSYAEAQSMNSSSTRSLSQQWAKKYVSALLSEQDSSVENLTSKIDTRKHLRARVAEKLLQSLRSSSLDAWAKTEALLSVELKRHQLNPRLINPWQITQDVYQIYEKALELYTDQGNFKRLSTVIAPDVGRVRQKYTAQDPRVIGFVSMQFHYTGVQLQAQLSPIEKSLISNCFKVVDDHLYMPLHRAYAAAGQHPYDSPALDCVRNLIPHSSAISERIVQRVIALYPHYSTHTGPLINPTVQTSSVRDVEMFQVYLWVCILEQNLSILQEELFPLCVMLYPPLKVNWELVRQMLHLLGQEIQNSNLGNGGKQVYKPYFQALWDMFSPEVFSN
jgi:hypothetical protein